MISLAILLLASSVAADDADRAEELTRRTYCVHAVSDGLLATGTSYGLVLYRLNERGFPTRAGALKLPDAVTALASKDGLVLAGNGPRGLVVVDVSDPDAPQQVGRLETPGAVLRLLGVGDVLYAAMGVMGVGQLDVTAPGKPAFVKRIDLDGVTRDLCRVRGGLVAAAKKLTLVQRPGTESPVMKRTGIPEPHAVACRGEILVAHEGTLHEVDETGFRAVGRSPTVLGDRIRDLEIIPGGVAVAAGSDGLVLMKQGAPESRIAARLDPGGGCTRVHSRGRLLFATADSYGFAVYDVKDLENPVKIYPAE